MCIKTMEGSSNMDDFELRLLTKEEVSPDTSLSVLRRSNAAFTVNTDLACLTGSIQNTNCSTYYSLQPNLEEEKFYFMHIEDYVEEEKKYDVTIPIEWIW